MRRILQPSTTGRRLAIGDLTVPDLETMALRAECLATLARLYPGFMERLARPAGTVDEWSAGLDDKARAERRRVRGQLIAEWLALMPFTAEWLEDWANRFIDRECIRLASGFTGSPLDWSGCVFLPSLMVGFVVVPDYSPTESSAARITPDPLVETRAEFLERASSAWNYVVSEMSSQGFEKTTITTREHLEWFIRYQVDNATSISKLAAEYQRDRSTVDEAIGRMASRLGITLRPASPGGRPPAS